MKVTLHSVSYLGGWGQKLLPVDKIIEKAAALGYDGVELAAKRPHLSALDTGADERKRLRDLIQSKGLELSALAGYTVFTDLDPHRREKEIMVTRELVQLAVDLGAPILRIFAGGMGDTPTHSKVPVMRRWVIEAIKECAKFAADAGIVLGLQNHQPIIYSYQDLNLVLDAIDSPVVKGVLDAPQMVQVQDDLTEGVKALGDRLVHTHTSDYRLSPGPAAKVPGGFTRTWKTTYVELGQGHVDYGTFVKALKSIGFKGHLSYEMCSSLPGGGSEENLDRIARESLAESRRLIAEA